MLDQIKNLIKHGKSVVGTTNVNEQDDTSTSDKFEKQREADASLLKHPDTQHLDDATLRLVETVPKKQHMSNNEKTARIVEEENRQKNTMPVYPGLERFQLLEKMGEYVNAR